MLSSLSSFLSMNNQDSVLFAAAVLQQNRICCTMVDTIDAYGGAVIEDPQDLFTLPFLIKFTSGIESLE